MRWLDGHGPATFITALTLAELRDGAGRLPEGPRRTALHDAIGALETEAFAGRVLPFDAACASAYARIVGLRRRAGRPITPLDALIAAIAATHGARLATRNIRDFEGLGLSLVDPFAPEA